MKPDVPCDPELEWAGWIFERSGQLCVEFDELKDSRLVPGGRGGVKEFLLAFGERTKVAHSLYDWPEGPVSSPWEVVDFNLRKGRAVSFSVSSSRTKLAERLSRLEWPRGA